MALTDLKIRTAKPADTQLKLYDGGGLLLLITPAGGKRWLFKYRIDYKEKSLALGTYPAVSLPQARERRDSAREQLAAGLDPSEAKKAGKRAAKLAAANSFELVAREWFETQRGGWSEVYAGKVISSLEIDVFPRIGDRPIASIDAPELLAVIRLIESRGVRETAKRVLQRTRGVFQYGIVTGRCPRNPAADIDAETVLRKSVGVQHMAHVKASEIPQLMRDIDAYSGDVVARLALKFMAVRAHQGNDPGGVARIRCCRRGMARAGRAHEDARPAHRAAFPTSAGGANRATRDQRATSLRLLQRAGA